MRIFLISFSDKVLNFLGNQTHKDHFKLLRSDGVSLLIGARNVVYNLSLADLSENIDQVRVEIKYTNSLDTENSDCLLPYTIYS